MNILILGPQGSGKGTQAQMVAEKLGLFYIEAGDMLRRLASQNQLVDKIINKEGKLLPDEETFSFLKGEIEKSAPDLNNLVFDGFPRSIKQYDLLKEWFHQKGLRLDLAIFLGISEKETIKRLSARRTCEKCGKVYNLISNPPPGCVCPCGGNLIQREDDTPQAIKVRLNIYRKTTAPLISQLEKEGILVRLNGQRPIKTIFTDILEIAKKHNE